jgi:hypothetical protein
VSEQPESLRLADWLDADACDLQTPRLAAAELRRLHAVNAELLKALKWIDRRCPKHLLDSDPHKIHREAAYDAGASARAAIAKATEVKP